MWRVCRDGDEIQKENREAATYRIFVTIFRRQLGVRVKNIEDCAFCCTVRESSHDAKIGCMALGLLGPKSMGGHVIPS